MLYSKWHDHTCISPARRAGLQNVIAIFLITYVFAAERIRFNRRRLLVIQDRWARDISNFALPRGVQLQRSETWSPGKKMRHIFIYLTCFTQSSLFSNLKCQDISDIARWIHLPSQCLPPSPLAAVASGWAPPLRQNRVVDGSKLK